MGSGEARGYTPGRPPERGGVVAPRRSDRARAIAWLVVWSAAALTGFGFPETGPEQATRPPRCVPVRSPATSDAGAVTYEGRRYRLYPDTLDTRPDLPSPLTTAEGTELVVAVLWNARFGIVPVTLRAERRQCDADGDDFPTLASTGLHSEAELDRTRTITGRPVNEINGLARPGQLSIDGFLGREEDIVSVLKADNRIVTALGLTHAELARPLFHIWNMMDTDLDLGRWNMAEHRWHNIAAVHSHGRLVTLVAGDTKGGQLSIFADGLEGSFWIEIAVELTRDERRFLATRYATLNSAEMERLVLALTRLRTGEMQPHYITWYGFYEGRTPWRTDPIAIALVFGLRTLEQIEAAFPGRLHDVMNGPERTREPHEGPGRPTQCPRGRGIRSWRCRRSGAQRAVGSGGHGAAVALRSRPAVLGYMLPAIGSLARLRSDRRRPTTENRQLEASAEHLAESLQRRSHGKYLHPLDLVLSLPAIEQDASSHRVVLTEKPQPGQILLVRVPGRGGNSVSR